VYVCPSPVPLTSQDYLKVLDSLVFWLLNIQWQILSVYLGRKQQYYIKQIHTNLRAVAPVVPFIPDFFGVFFGRIHIAFQPPPDEGDSRNASCALMFYMNFFYIVLLLSS
jgi:hypothetical protein